MKYWIELGDEFYIWPIKGDTKVHALSIYCNMENKDAADMLRKYEDGSIKVHDEDEYDAYIEAELNEELSKREEISHDFTYILMRGIDEGPSNVKILNVTSEQTALETMLESINDYHDHETEMTEILGGHDSYENEIAFLGGDGDSASWFSLFKIEK